MPINEPLFRDAVAHIELDQRAFDMGTWIRADPECGTAMCLAGHTLAAAGYTVEQISDLSSEGTYALPMAARRLLGLGDLDAYELFHYVSVIDPDCGGVGCECRDVTVDDMKAKITEVTGIEFKKADVDAAVVEPMAA